MPKKVGRLIPKLQSSWAPAGQGVKTGIKKSNASDRTNLKAKPVTAKPANHDGGPRRLALPKKVWYNPLTWRRRRPVPERQPLPKARHLFLQVGKQLWQYRKLFGGIIVIYGILNLLLVRGLAGSSNLSTLKTTLNKGASGLGEHAVNSATSFAYLLGTSGSGSSATSGVYQTILLIICSLAFIWALRQALALNTVRIRDSFYQGMYPLVPFLLLILIIGLQLLPLAIGGALYATVIADGIAVQAWEKLLWGVLFAGLAFWSLRMVTASLFGLYIVTLPDMTPVAALRKANELVYGRRLLIWRKLIFLPVGLLLVAAVVELPLIAYATSVAPWIFFGLSMIALPAVHGYIYGLYRELL